MPDPARDQDHGPEPADRGASAFDRRTLLRRGLLAGGILLGGGALGGLGRDALAGPSTGGRDTARALAGPRRRGARHGSSGPDRPNVLVLMVDQMRTSPHWLTGAPVIPASLPNLTRLSRGSVTFGAHYTAANDCSPSRAALLTGLYTHQTGCMITGGSTLSPRFPTWGTLMREHGYKTWWYGKWHLTHGDNRWREGRSAGALERYGFSGGTYPSPDGAPGEGTHVDPLIADQFEEWFQQEAPAGPWCTTVSFVNPHDIAWWYRWTNRVPAEWFSPPVTSSMPPNFETTEDLLRERKPRLQRSLQDTAATAFGPLPFSGPNVAEAWLPFLDLYAQLQARVDHQIGRVLSILESRPEVAARTVILFTSDHGEYGGSHGLRGKGAGVYEEAIRVPLLVKDPRGILTRQTGRPRRQLTSSVDIAPLLLTIASGSDRWRRDPRYEHLAGRADLAAILADPGAPGRPFVLHTTDEIITEYALEPYASDAPLHVAAIRTHRDKLALYSNWREGSTEIRSHGQEGELYDLRTREGALELRNSLGSSSREARLRDILGRAIDAELARPLPSHLVEAQREGFGDYYSTATRAALKALDVRRRRIRREGREPSDWSPFEEFGIHGRLHYKRLGHAFVELERHLRGSLGGLPRG